MVVFCIFMVIKMNKTNEYIELKDLKSHQRKEKFRSFLGKTRSFAKKYGEMAYEAGKKFNDNAQKNRGKQKKTVSAMNELGDMFSSPPSFSGKSKKNKEVKSYNPFTGERY